MLNNNSVERDKNPKKMPSTSMSLEQILAIFI